MVRAVVRQRERANTAVSHKLVRVVYSMLTRGEAFVDQGQQCYEEQQRQRGIAASGDALPPSDSSSSQCTDSMKINLSRRVS